MKDGDIVYTVETRTATLSHQDDTVELSQGIILEGDKENKYERKKIYFLVEELLYSVGKNSYNKKGLGMGSVGTRFEIPFPGKEVFLDINEAKKEIVQRIFEKKKWLS